MVLVEGQSVRFAWEGRAPDVSYDRKDSRQAEVNTIIDLNTFTSLMNKRTDVKQCFPLGDVIACSF